MPSSVSCLPFRGRSLSLCSSYWFFCPNISICFFPDSSASGGGEEVQDGPLSVQIPHSASCGSRGEGPLITAGCPGNSGQGDHSGGWRGGAEHWALLNPWGEAASPGFTLHLCWQGWWGSRWGPSVSEACDWAAQLLSEVLLS